MRENKPVLLVLSAYDEEIILEKGEILSEKRHSLLSMWIIRGHPGVNTNFKLVESVQLSWRLSVLSVFVGLLLI